MCSSDLKRDGKELPGLDRHTGFFINDVGPLMKSPFTFRRYGGCGKWVSSIFPCLARHVDRMAFIHSLHGESNNHSPALFMINTGTTRMGYPCAGAWVTYGLGSENQDLPGFIAMCPGGYPIVGPANWRSAFLPGALQGTYIDTKHQDVTRLIENIRHPAGTPAEQRRQLDLVRRLNERHRALRG